MRIELGKFGEQCAEKHLAEQGYEIVCRNYRTRLGEIDLIAAIDSYIVFVEVKTQTSASIGRPSDQVTASKIRKVTNCALSYMEKHSERRQPRFDIVEVIATRRGNEYSALQIVHHPFAW